MKSPLTISLNPSYLCNFRCNFCYLTEAQLSSRKKATLESIDQKLKEADELFQIEHIDLYGGEVALLGQAYLEALYKLSKKYGVKNFNIITNLSKVLPIFHNEYISLSVSYDFKAREQHETVLKNMMTLPRKISILILASKDIIQEPVLPMVETLNMLSNICSVEIKPYSTNQANQQSVSFKDFEEFVKKWIVLRDTMNFEFVNLHYIEESLNGSRSAYSDNHLYLTPESQWAVLEFDAKDREYFMILNDISDYFAWASAEKSKVFNNAFCANCSYQGGCLTEHYRSVTGLEHSCNGFKHLLDWSAAEGIAKRDTKIKNFSS